MHPAMALARAAVSEAMHTISAPGLRPLHPPADRRRRSLSDRPAGVVAGTPPSGEWAGAGASSASPASTSSAAAVRRQSLDAGGAARRGSLDVGASGPAPPRRRASVDGGRLPVSFDVPAFLPNVS